MNHLVYRKETDGPVWLQIYDYEAWVAGERKRIDTQASTATDEQRAKLLAETIEKNVKAILAAREVLLCPGGYKNGKWVYGEPTHVFNGKSFEPLLVAA